MQQNTSTLLPNRCRAWRRDCPSCAMRTGARISRKTPESYWSAGSSRRPNPGERMAFPRHFPSSTFLRTWSTSSPCWRRQFGGCPSLEVNGCAVVFQWTGELSRPMIATCWGRCRRWQVSLSRLDSIRSASNPPAARAVFSPTGSWTDIRPWTSGMSIFGAACRSSETRDICTTGPSNRSASSTQCTGRFGSPRAHVEFVSPRLHDRLAQRGACFGEVAGYERPNWFAPTGVAPEYRYSYGRQNWFEYSGSEHRAVRERVGLFDQSSFAKFVVAGADAESVLNQICAGGHRSAGRQDCLYAVAERARGNRSGPHRDARSGGPVSRGHGVCRIRRVICIGFGAHSRRRRVPSQSTFRPPMPYWE